MIQVNNQLFCYFCQILYKIAKFQLQAQSFRCILNYKNYYKCYELFNKIAGSSSLQPLTLQYFIIQHSHKSILLKECQLWISKFSQFQSNKLQYIEFFKALTVYRPFCEIQVRRQLQIMSVQELFCLIVHTQVLELETLYKLINQSFQNGIIIQQIYNILDRHGKGFINVLDIQFFFDYLQICLPRDIAKAIINFFDKDINYQITFKSFTSFFWKVKKDFNKSQESKFILQKNYLKVDQPFYNFLQIVKPVEPQPVITVPTFKTSLDSKLHFHFRESSKDLRQKINPQIERITFDHRPGQIKRVKKKDTKNPYKSQRYRSMQRMEITPMLSHRSNKGDSSIQVRSFRLEDVSGISRSYYLDKFGKPIQNEVR